MHFRNCLTILLFIVACAFSHAVISQNCTGNSTGFIPVADLGESTFQGFSGGKYPGGRNHIPYSHFLKGKEMSSQIVPLNKNGEPDSINGAIGFMVLGFSTAAMTGRSFFSICGSQPVNKKLEFVIGAQGGRDINSMTDSSSTYWTNIDSSLIEKGITYKQIQIIWVSTGDISGYKLDFPEQSLTQIEKYKLMLLNIEKYFPNIKLVFISDRTYAGYIGGENGGPADLAEPTAYYNSWAVKWLIEKQVKNEAGYNYESIPFIDWGPLLWTDGATGNRSGYKWECDDAGKGGIHPSSKGRMKEAALLYLFFTQHPYTRNILITTD